MGCWILDLDKHLILLKNEDKTSEIESCDLRKGQWQIKFYNTQNVYTYKKKNVVWIRDPILIDPSTCIVYENDQAFYGVSCIQDFGNYIRLIFNSGFIKTLKRFELTIEQSCLMNNKTNACFDYLKAIANQISIKLDEDITFLGKQYHALVSISPRSVLAAYLEKRPLAKVQLQQQVIFPFGFNISQKSATEKALGEQISVIEGPPGTGKTQTILNIIANAVMNNKTVAVVSNNNSATANVQEKLQKYGLDFIVAYLGNNENKDHFFATQSGKYPDMSKWVLEESEYQILKTKIRDDQDKLNKMLGFKNQQALLKQQLAELQTEYQYFKVYYSTSMFKQPQVNSFFRWSAEKVLNMLVEYKYILNKGEINLKNKIYNFFVYGIYNFRIYKYSPEVVISYLQKTYYDLKIIEINNRIQDLENKLYSYNFDRSLKKYSENSMKLFKAHLVKTFGRGEKRKVFSKEALWKDFGNYIKEYPVILSTTHSLRNSTANNYLFDYVLMDESSQVDLATGALAMSCAKNVVIVGDTKQLPNVVPTEVKDKATNLFHSYNLEEAYNYAEHSLLSSIVSLYKDIPRTLLKEHYRCHPKIIGFCNQKFYNNELIVLTNTSGKENPLILYKTLKGNHARGRFNQRQIDIIFNEIIPNQEINIKEQSLGIITPYRMQADELKYTIGDQDIEADTVHKFQGREKDIIVLSTVSNEIKVNDFADDANLINVAVSRAVDQLIVVVSNTSDDWNGTNIGDLIRYIKYNNFEIIESEIYSIFDLLYSSYSDKLIELMKNSKRVSEHHSENLMNLIIKKVVDQEVFSSLNYVLHQPLRMLIKDTDKLTVEERKYAMNILTHIDFLIFNKLDKQPVLAVEVDGHAYHSNNPKQQERDKLKDQILNKYGIPLIRLKTTGSGEEALLHNKLSELIGLESR
jgi:superfamily I DNA and/or RNA helicase